MALPVPRQPDHSPRPDRPASGQKHPGHKLWASRTASAGTPNLPSEGCKSPPPPQAYCITHRQHGRCGVGGGLPSEPLSRGAGFGACTDAGVQACRPGAPTCCPDPPHAHHSTPVSRASSDHMHTMTGECSCQHLRAARGRVGRAAGGPEQAGGQTLPHPREQTGHRERKRAGSQGAHGAKVGPSTVPFPVCPKPGLYVGGGSRGPRAFRCVWCARTTGSPAHTGQSRLPRAGSGWRAAPSLA